MFWVVLCFGLHDKPYLYLPYCYLSKPWPHSSTIMNSRYYCKVSSESNRSSSLSFSGFPQTRAEGWGLSGYGFQPGMEQFMMTGIEVLRPDALVRGGILLCS